MIGAIIGDIVGSRFEFNNHKSKKFELFTKKCRVTDDSIMPLAIAKAIMVRQGFTKSEIREEINRKYYSLDFTIDEIRDTYEFDVSCQGSVPQAIVAFLESTSFEDAIRTAVSIGGDSDTLAAITGSIAQAYYGVPEEIKEKALSYLDDYLRSIYDEWCEFIEYKDCNSKYIDMDI